MARLCLLVQLCTKLLCSYHDLTVLWHAGLAGLYSATPMLLLLRWHVALGRLELRCMRAGLGIAFDSRSPLSRSLERTPFMPPCLYAVALHCRLSIAGAAMSFFLPPACHVMLSLYIA
ncbi:unnamed protein product [Cercospora beticola]|nr:unnamed protein product [Cercospora beticola]